MIKTVVFDVEDGDMNWTWRFRFSCTYTNHLLLRLEDVMPVDPVQLSNPKYEVSILPAIPSINKFMTIAGPFVSKFHPKYENNNSGTLPSMVHHECREPSIWCSKYRVQQRVLAET